jgi:uncharacterized membrane protein
VAFKTKVFFFCLRSIGIVLYMSFFACRTQQYTNQLAHVSLCITEFIVHTISLHVSAHRTIIRRYINKPYTIELCFLYGLPLWSSGQSFWLQIRRSRVRFPDLPDFLRNRGSGTGSTHPREDN